MWRRSISRQDININGMVGEPAYSHDKVGCYHVVFLVVSLELLSLSLSQQIEEFITVKNNVLNCQRW